MISESPNNRYSTRCQIPINLHCSLCSSHSDLVYLSICLMVLLPCNNQYLSLSHKRLFPLRPFATLQTYQLASIKAIISDNKNLGILLMPALSFFARQDNFELYPRAKFSSHLCQQSYLIVSDINSILAVQTFLSFQSPLESSQHGNPILNSCKDIRLKVYPCYGSFIFLDLKCHHLFIG